MPNELLVRNGRVIDPANGVDAVLDIAVADGHITAIGPDLITGPDTEVIDATGAIVTPGLIDLHVHIFPGLGNFCVSPDQAGVERGVPIVVDGGTSGTATIDLALDWLDAAAPRTKVLAFMDPNVLYLATHDFICHKLEIANDVRNIDVDAAVSALDRHPDRLVGLKVRVCHTGDPHHSPFLDAAKQIAGDRPVMVHLGRFPHTPTMTTPDLLDQLRDGDVITHAFRGASGVLEQGTGVPTHHFTEAVDRGVRLDVGHSATDFRFGDARKLIDAGYVPDTISTDMNIFNIDTPVVSLPETMSKILALGLPLNEVIAMATVRSAETIRRADQFGTLDIGRPAEVSVLRLVEGPAHLSDGFETIEASQRLVPVGCVRGGEWMAATAGLEPELVGAP
jgi:dihydroorotase